jgi:hypothetical protein
MATIPVVISPVQACYRCVNVDLSDGGSEAKHPADLAVSGRDALSPLVDVFEGFEGTSTDRQLYGG